MYTFTGSEWNAFIKLLLVASSSSSNNQTREQAHTLVTSLVEDTRMLYQQSDSSILPDLWRKNGKQLSKGREGRDAICLLKDEVDHLFVLPSLSNPSLPLDFSPSLPHYLSVLSLGGE